MMKKTYTISNKAIADLEEIWEYTLRNWSVGQADRSHNLIIEDIEYLCTDSDSGKQSKKYKFG